MNFSKFQAIEIGCDAGRLVSGDEGRVEILAEDIHRLRQVTQSFAKDLVLSLGEGEADII